MRIVHQDYAELHLLSGIMADYQKRSPLLSPFIADFPSLPALLKAADQRQFPDQSREVLCNLLSQQYASLPQSTAVSESIHLLRQANTFTVTTGHQLCVGSGPAFFVYKIISAIKLARQLKEANPERNFIPVYWMASEDHDFEEVNHLYVQNKKITWPSAANGAVGRLPLVEMDAFWQEVKEAWPGEPGWEARVEELRKPYESGTLASATLELVHHMFQHYGLLVLNPDSPELKQLFRPYLWRELKEQPSEMAVNTSSQALQELGYQTQVFPRPINLFFLENESRERIVKEGDVWKVNKRDVQFSALELENMVNEHPELFSPNVVLRPLYQEVILPNIAYIGGPGEINYWFQLKGVFSAFAVPFPILLLRNNAVVFSTKVQERITKVGFGWKDFFRPKSDLIQEVVGTAQQDLMTDYKARMQELFTEIAAVLAATDATLEASTKAEAQKAINGLDNLEKKLTRALKTKEEQRIQQIERILQEIKPNGATQDRTANFFELDLRVGGNLVETLLEAFNPLENSYTVCLAE